MQKYPEHAKFEEARSCTRKRKFQTAATARSTAVDDGMAATLEMAGVYKCRFCDGYHLTRGFRTPAARGLSQTLV